MVWWGGGGWGGVGGRGGARSGRSMPDPSVGPSPPPQRGACERRPGVRAAPAAPRRAPQPTHPPIIRKPAASTAMPVGTERRARVAGPPSPTPVMGLPPPATVVRAPLAASRRRTRLLAVSATYTLPAASTQAPCGLERRALVPAPPSPLKPWLPLPATVVMTPLAPSTRRRRWFCVSEKRGGRGGRCERGGAAEYEEGGGLRARPSPRRASPAVGAQPQLDAARAPRSPRRPRAGRPRAAVSWRLG